MCKLNLYKSRKGHLHAPQMTCKAKRHPARGTQSIYPSAFFWILSVFRWQQPRAHTGASSLVPYETLLLPLPSAQMQSEGSDRVHAGSREVTPVTVESRLNCVQAKKGVAMGLSGAIRAGYRGTGEEGFKGARKHWSQGPVLADGCPPWALGRAIWQLFSLWAVERLGFTRSRACWDARRHPCILNWLGLCESIHSSAWTPIN